MLIHSNSLLLNSLTGQDRVQYQARVVRGHFRVRKVADPLDAVDELVAKLFDDSDDPNDAKVNSRLRNRRTDKLGYDRKTGHMLFNGRRCCFSTVQELDRRIGTLVFPHRQVCPVCKTEYEVISTFAPEAR